MNRRPTPLRSTFARVTAFAAFAIACSWPTGVLAQQSPLVGYEDIDLFANPPQVTDLPNVLLLLDTSANWSANAADACVTYDDGTPGPRQSNPGKEQGYKIAIQKCALVNTMLALPTNPDGSAKFRVGVMYMNAPNADGAYPRVRFLEVDAVNKPILVEALKNTWIDGVGDQGSNADYSRALWEAWLWYKSDPAAGAGKLPLYGKAQTNASRQKWDAGAFDANGYYVSPSTASCGRNYVIVISNGAPQGTEADIQPLIVAAGGNGTKINYSNSYITTADQNNWADETARFLFNEDVSGRDGTQNIITYSIAISVPNPNSSEQRVLNFVKEIALQGGGKFYSASNVSELTSSLNAIFNQIAAVNSVFASASLPVSVNAQGTFLNQVFMGMFRPDTAPRWAGNLKQYQFRYTAATQKVDLVDAAGNVAISPTTGFIDPSARSFWSSASPYADFWKNKNWEGEVNVGGDADAPDGQIVEKGGAAQRFREQFMSSQAGRNMLTTGLLGGLVPLNTLNVSASDLGLGALDVAGQAALVAWARGADNKSPSDEQGPGTVTNTATGASVTATVRGSIHGDVIHSSPAVVNYGGSTGVVVYYGTNAGTLHAVRGAKTGNGGQELWSFMPREFLPNIKRLRDNAPPVQFASTDMTAYPSATRKNYGMDGSLTFYQNLDNGTVYLYATMRRGGRAVYAFNVTDPTSPSLLWKRDHTSTGLGILGQTWSEPRVTRIAGFADPVIIMGAGYDPGEDSASPGSPSMGNGVIVLNARTGAVLKVFSGTTRPVPASVAMVDTDGDRMTDRAYAVDLGGAVYRLEFTGNKAGTSNGTNNANQWTMTPIADFSGSTGTGQKMFYAPAVTPTTIGGSVVYAIQIGTGDREKPLASATENRFYTVLDKGQTSAVDLDDLQPMTTAGLSTIDSEKYGCYLTLPNTGEKVVNAVTYTSGFAFFGTNAPTPPSPNSCTGTLGVARSYAIPALCGPATIVPLDGGGLPPTAVVGTVLVAPPPGENGAINCDITPAECARVPVGIGINPPDCAGSPSSMRSSIGATNIYACAPPQRLRRDWSIANPR